MRRYQHIIVEKRRISILLRRERVIICNIFQDLCTTWWYEGVFVTNHDLKLSGEASERLRSGRMHQLFAEHVVESDSEDVLVTVTKSVTLAYQKITECAPSCVLLQSFELGNASRSKCHPRQWTDMQT